MTRKNDDQPSKPSKPSKEGTKKKLAGHNVIHVAFGPGGGRVAFVEKTPGSNARPPPANTRADEPVTDLFSKKEVSKLLGLSEGRLRVLDKNEIVSPSGEKAGKRAYTFRDLIALRATLMLAKDVSIRDVAKAIGALRRTLPRVARPLHELKIVSDGHRVVVRAPGGAFEPLTGQLVLDFNVETLQSDVVRVLRPGSAAGRAKTAYDLYTRASALDEDPATYDEAEALYVRALQLDPELAIAYTNLGNIRFRRGDEPGAEELYRRALGLDDRQPEAHYNLGYVMLERGNPTDAASYFERALERDPRFSDAHFNLAMALEQLGDSTKARTHWKRYLELEPSGTWADIARQQL
ncbi:MAG: tetratricopeptide repeat protein [Polyangiaceae bacterium]